MHTKPDTNPHVRAFRPLAKETVTFRLSGETRAEPVDGGAKCRALVRLVNANAENVGSMKAGEHWVVRFVASDLKSFTNVAKGTVIEADRVSNAWPQLTVQKRPQVNNGICTLDCSANEMGRKV